MTLSFINCKNGLAAVAKAKKQGMRPIAYACNSIAGSYWVFDSHEELSAWILRQPLNPHYEVIA